MLEKYASKDGVSRPFCTTGEDEDVVVVVAVATVVVDDVIVANVDVVGSMGIRVDEEDEDDRVDVIAVGVEGFLEIGIDDDGDESFVDDDDDDVVVIATAAGCKFLRQKKGDDLERGECIGDWMGDGDIDNSEDDVYGDVERDGIVGENGIIVGNDGLVGTLMGDRMPCVRGMFLIPLLLLLLLLLLLVLLYAVSSATDSLKTSSAEGRFAGSCAIILSMSAMIRAYGSASSGRAATMIAFAEPFLTSNHLGVGFLGIWTSIRMSKNVAPREYMSACVDATTSGALYLSSPTDSSCISEFCTAIRSLAEPKSPSTTPSLG